MVDFPSWVWPISSETSRLPLQSRWGRLRSPVSPAPLANLVSFTLDLGDLYAESRQTLKGSFSAVSKPKFESKYSLELGSIWKEDWKALAEIYKMHSFAPFWNRIPKTGKTMGRKEPGPYNPGKTWPGEAHKQPQLATQFSNLNFFVKNCWNFC